VEYQFNAGIGESILSRNEVFVDPVCFPHEPPDAIPVDCATHLSTDREADHDTRLRILGCASGNAVRAFQVPGVKPFAFADNLGEPSGTPDHFRFIQPKSHTGASVRA
jgi:hypothetical protein